MTTTRKALAASTALALMMGAAPAFAQQGNSCDNLLQRLESMPQELPEGVDWTIRDVEEAAASGDAQRCEVILARVDESMQQQDGETQQAQDGAQDSETMTAVASEQQRVTLEDEEVVEGIVRLNRQSPRVEVEEGQTEVQVTPGQSSVSVQEQAAQIMVREQPARITVDVPQPTIRIEQAAPEIIITMPEPGVDVTDAEPRIEIRQAEPRVTVQQSAPSIDLELRLADNPDQSEGVQIEDSASGESYAMGEERQLPSEEAEVTMTRSEPVIRMQRSQDSNAQVNIARAEPQVTYERAEPQVEMTRSGEINVDYASSGEPNITIRREGGGESAGSMQQTDQAQADTQSGGTMQQTDQAQADTQSGGTMQQTDQAQADAQADATMQQTDQAQADVQTETTMQQTDQAQAAPTDLGISVDGYETVGFGNMTADDLTGMQVYSPNDGSIGDIDGVVLSSDQMAIEQFIVDVGGFLGLGEHSVALNPDEIQLMQGQNGELRAYVNMTEQELTDRPRYDQ